MKLDCSFRRLGFDRKYIDLTSADGDTFYSGTFSSFLICLEGDLNVFLRLKEDMKGKDI